MTLNFIHFSIQEFLAAYHITQLPPQEELQVLKAKFWSNLHSNMFAMYTSLTKGQQPAFKQFLCGGDNMVTISQTFLKDQIKCLRLYGCFREANDEVFYTYIQNSQIFDDKVINLRLTSLSPYDIECVTLFLTCSHEKQWRLLKLYWCDMQDHGLRVFHRDLMRSNVTVRVLVLYGNGLTRSSASLIGDLSIHCNVEELAIGDNYAIGEDSTLYNMLSHPSSRLTRLYMENTSLSAASAMVLFTAVAKGNKLQLLYISQNNITDDAGDVIAASLKINSSLCWLRMRSNKISAKTAQHVVKALQQNNTLQELWLPFYPDFEIDRIKLLQEEVNKHRENRGCQTKLTILSSYYYWS